jgi:hypothetical protein
MNGDLRERWLEANERHLRLALAWLRANLERLAANPPRDDGLAQTVNAPPAPVPVVPRRGPRLGLFGRGASEPVIPVSPVVMISPSPPDAPLPLPEALPLPEGMHTVTAGEPKPALIELAERLGLTRFEAQMLLLAAAPELDTRFSALCAAAQRDPARPWPTPALALAALPEPGWEALLPARPLRRYRLIELQETPGGALVQAPMRVDERVLHLLKGCNEPDSRLLALAARAPVPQPLPPSQARLVEALAAAPPREALHLVGPDAPSRRQVAAALVAHSGGQLLCLPAERVPAAPGEVEALARLIEREARLLPLVLFLEFPAEPPPAAADLARRLGDSTAGLLIVSAPAPLAGVAERAPAMPVARPTTAEQAALWAQALGDEAAAESLAAQFDLDPGGIRDLAAVVGAEHSEAPPLKRVWAAALAATRPALERLAQPVQPVARFDDMVLPDAAMGLLRQIVQQVRHRAQVYESWGFAERGPRGLGISALFAGQSGTGKTMAAEALAAELELPLWQTDLAMTHSKWIGETEKNCKELFDAAERGGAVLFFDEADALFGKRSEVKDAHDRYANIQIDYLLQRRESYRGLAILATNMKSALDPAFLRRLRFVVDFPFPGPAERTRLWAQAFPAGVPTAGLEPELLARLNLTGGSIRNIALNAAFLAAARGMEVTMPIVMETVRTELEKLERPASEGELVQPRARGGGAR